ncbi:MAG: hypothetical protein IPM04_04525 [Saprospiraceae bacterium]|nr:hypothetical protein [Candidatus Brachybacter algidus]MBK8747133.1 hypothetical protein [Candidatus Brachybacter algidus]
MNQKRVYYTRLKAQLRKYQNDKPECFLSSNYEIKRLIVGDTDVCIINVKRTYNCWEVSNGQRYISYLYVYLGKYALLLFQGRMGLFKSGKLT